MHFIVIDGVDKCTEYERKILFRALNDITTTSLVALKLLISSRIEIPQKVKSGLKSWNSIQLNLQQISSNIRRYVENELLEAMDSKCLATNDPGLIQEI